MTEDNGEKSSKGLTSQDTMEMGWLLAGGGILGSLYLLIKKSRNIFSWIIAVGMVAAGIGLALKDHQQRIEQTGDQIIAQLDELDPITRAEVIKYVADQEIDRITL
ncbi:hypothetical protein ACFLTC_00845 [Chloroflexota bacterium]